MRSLVKQACLLLLQPSSLDRSGLEVHHRVVDCARHFVALTFLTGAINLEVGCRLVHLSFNLFELDLVDREKGAQVLPAFQLGQHCWLVGLQRCCFVKATLVHQLDRAFSASDIFLEPLADGRTVLLVRVCRKHTLSLYGRLRVHR